MLFWSGQNGPLRTTAPVWLVPKNTTAARLVAVLGHIHDVRTAGVHAGASAAQLLGVLVGSRMLKVETPLFMLSLLWKIIVTKFRSSF